MASEKSSRRYRLKDEIAYQKVGEEFILVQPVNQELHRTNETGQKILEAIEEDLSVEEIVNKLCNEFDVDRSQANEDVDKFLEELRGKDLIEIADERSSHG